MLKEKDASSPWLHIGCQVTSTDGYTLHVDQQQAKQHTNPAPDDTHGYRKSTSCLRSKNKTVLTNSRLLR